MNDEKESVDPHEDDTCVVCGADPSDGKTMHPVVGIDDGCLCEGCIQDENGRNSRYLGTGSDR